MQPAIPLSEFARRLCEAAHPGFGSTGNPVPCGTHVRDGQRLWGLLTDTAALEVIARVRVESGIDDFSDDPMLDTAVDLHGLVVDGIEAFRLTREYVGTEVLLEAPGWAWFDWVQRAREATRTPVAT